MSIRAKVSRRIPRSWSGKIALTSLDAEQLASFLESPTSRAKRMRISSPFFWPAR